MDDKQNIDMDQIMLDLLVHEKFLVKEKLPNGKIWYRRTDKHLPCEHDYEHITCDGMPDLFECKKCGDKYGN